MKYMLIMNTPRDGYNQYMSWPRELIEANAAFMESFTKQLSNAGELVGAAGLGAPTQAKLIRAGSNGKPITDGVFPEFKEYLAGYWIIDVDSPERAYQIAADASKAPGAPIKGADGSSIDHLWIEVRQVLDSRHDLE
jgi:hypothetical protein